LQYHVVEEDSTDKLVKEVNSMLSKGWKPLGCIAITSNEDNFNYFFITCQAMIRKNEADKGS